MDVFPMILDAILKIRRSGRKMKDVVSKIWKGEIKVWNKKLYL